MRRNAQRVRENSTGGCASDTPVFYRRVDNVSLSKRSRGGIMLSRELPVLPIVNLQDDEEEYEWEEELDIEEEDDEYEFDDEDEYDEYAEYEEEFGEDDEPRRGRRPAEWE